MRIVRFGDVVAAVLLLETEPIKDVGGLLARLNESSQGCEVQLFNPDILVDWEHFDAALVSAVISFTSIGLARRLGMEILMRLAATDQATQAISFAGVSDGSHKVGLLVLGGDPEQVGRVSESARQHIDGRCVSLESSADRVEHIAAGYDVRAGPHIQARDRSEALKLAIIQRIATSALK